MIEQAPRLAGILWAEATRLAESTHEALQAQWAQEKKDKDDELVADLDAATTRATHTEQAAAEARAAGEQTRSERTQLQSALAAAEATAAATSRAHDALLASTTATNTDTGAKDPGKKK